MIRSIVLLVFGGLLMLMALRKLRRQQLKEKYALLFAATALPFLMLALWPDGIVYLSDLTQIEKPTIMVMALSIFALLMIFELLRIVSVQDRKITSLAQEIAILRQHLGNPGVKGGAKPDNRPDSRPDHKPAPPADPTHAGPSTTDDGQKPTDG